MIASALCDGVKIHLSKLDLIDEAVLKEGKTLINIVAFLCSHCFWSIFEFVLKLFYFFQQFRLSYLAGKSLLFELHVVAFVFLRLSSPANHLFIFFLYFLLVKIDHFPQPILLLL